ncbi:MAG TPA: membrane dipeptidase [Caulobacteraceae bacterium]|nr:membrane dipeptidase [Caulobacteraceae bacterium]
MQIDRRRVLALGAGLAASAAATRAMAFAPARGAPVINGNLISPVDDETRFDAETIAQIRASGLTAFKISLGGSNSDYAWMLEELAFFDRVMALQKDVYANVRTLAELDAVERGRRVGMIYSFESVEMLDGKLDRIDEFHGRGVRVMQLCYNQPSAFASGVMSRESTGLTPLGHEAVERMNRLGVSIDVSHSDERSTLETLAASKRPVSVTHAGCAALEAHPRHKSDAVLRAVADQGGVVGIYELPYLTGGRRQPTVEDYMAHMAHALKVCGEDHVGVGSDALLTPFDTGPESMAQWNKSIAARKAAGVSAPGEGLPPFVEGLNRPDRTAIIAAELARRGYPARVVDKVLGANFRRWFGETWVG